MQSDTTSIVKTGNTVTVTMVDGDVFTVDLTNDSVSNTESKTPTSTQQDSIDVAVATMKIIK